MECLEAALVRAKQALLSMMQAHNDVRIVLIMRLLLHRATRPGQQELTGLAVSGFNLGLKQQCRMPEVTTMSNDRLFLRLAA